MAKKVRTQEAVGESRCGEDSRKPPGAFPDRPLGRWRRRPVQPAQSPSNPLDSGVARGDPRERRARPARGLPQPRARAAAEPPSRGPRVCLCVCPQGQAPAVCVGPVLAWRTAGVGRIFFFFLPGPRRVARSPQAAGSGGNRKEPPVRKAPRGGTSRRTSGTGRFPRASGRRVCVEAAGRDLPAGRARPGGSRGPALLPHAARSARLSPACARAGRCSNDAWRRELQCLRRHQCGCEMGCLCICASVRH